MDIEGLAVTLEMGKVDLMEFGQRESCMGEPSPLSNGQGVTEVGKNPPWSKYPPLAVRILRWRRKKKVLIVRKILMGSKTPPLSEG